MEILRTVWRLIWSTKYTSLLNIIMWATFGTLGVTEGIIIKKFFDALAENSGSIMNLSILLIFNTLGLMISFHLAGQVYAHQTFRMSGSFRENIITKILDDPNSNLHQKSTGQIVNYIKEDVEQITELAGQLNIAPGYFVLVIIKLGIMFQINAEITLYLSIPIIIVMFILQSATTKLRNNRSKSRQTTVEVTSFISDIFNSVQAIQIAGGEKRVVHRLGELGHKRKVSMVKENLFYQTLSFFSSNTIQLSTAIILLGSAALLKTEEFTVGDFALFIAYLRIINGNIGAWKNNAIMYKQSFTSLRRLQEISAPLLQPRGTRKRVPTTLQRFSTLELRDITCHYPTTMNGINNINMKINKNTITVITGRVGSGKTTLLKTIIGLTKANNGNIFWNGKRMSSLQKKLEPPQVAYTPQIPHLFSQSVKENILLGLSEDSKQLHKSIYLSVLDDDLIRLEKGINTIVGTNGVKLSGGQIQRTAISRMFVRNADIYIMDDFVSSLDVSTANKVWNRIVEYKNQYSFTLIVVSHDRNILQQADHIVLLSGGRIEEQGTLNHLLKTSNEMNYLWK